MRSSEQQTQTGLGPSAVTHFENTDFRLALLHLIDRVSEVWKVADEQNIISMRRSQAVRTQARMYQVKMVSIKPYGFLEMVKDSQDVRDGKIAVTIDASKA